MIGYTTLGVKDMARAKSFYVDLLADQGAKLLMDMGRIAFVGKSMRGPMVALCVPYNEEDPHPGNGAMIAFPAGSQDAADKMYHKAIALGATCEGKPGSRIEGKFYGAYVRDPDGNKLAFYDFS